jgi:hypoxanthine phosphoribosyltransferase
MAAINAEQARRVLASADLLCSRARIEQALDNMALDITRRLQHCDPLVLVVMNGALVPAAHLFTRLGFPFQIDYVHATRYGDTTSGKELNWLVSPHVSVQERVILVVDDIFDEGATLQAILEHLRQAHAQAVYSAVLVNKKHNRKAPGLSVDFVGLEVEDRYVFGFGMDYKEYWRNLPNIYAVGKTMLSS